MYQLAGSDAEAALLEKRIIFLGGSTGNLRSSLAFAMQNNPGAEASVWSPSLSEEKGTGRRGLFSLRASESFSRCMRREAWYKDLGDRHVQTRLLWELQSYFQGMIPVEGLSPERHEAILLCLLSFPAIDFTVIEEGGGHELNAKRTREGVHIAFEKPNPEAKIRTRQ